MKKQTLLLHFLPLLLLLNSCAAVLSKAKVRQLTTDYCQPNIHYNYTYKAETPTEESSLKNFLSQHDLLLSKHIGIISLLENYIHSTDTLRKLYYKQKITDRIMLVTGELTSVSAELDCNGERIAQLANYVDNKNAKRNTMLTVSSVVVGALTTVATVAIKNNSASNTVGISGGLLSAGLGALTINPKGSLVEMTWQRNLLRNVWLADNQDQSFPPALWRILNEKAFSNTGDKSLIESIKNRWLQFAFDGAIDSNEQKLFFESGGKFSADDLHTLADMYNELQASVRSTQQDLQSLIIRMNTIE